ncbi:FtsX-like permease family protein [Microbacterium oleivorans]|uniref:Permease n=1 Tax=Microbacterium oleivorans TaxID=273677 RepID=A0A7D5EWF3_9MICO|nr:FtsX-like permease family protein [Microbacterium oleivorans]QLD11424.1 permease [Microbacterium oleivorans]
MSAVAPLAAPPIADRSASGAVRRLAALTVLLARPQGQGSGAIALPLAAFAVTTTLMLVVAGGTRMFLTDPRTGDLSLMYGLLSVLALILLAIPTATLGAAAARLSSRRRNDRLSTLRLLGATNAEVRAMAVGEAAVVAAAGALLGAAGYGLALPLVGLLPFFGGPVGAGAVWAGWPIVAGVVVGVALIATLSAVASLRRVRLTPLGVRRRTQAPPRRVRTLVVSGVGIVAVGIVVGQFGSVASLLAPAAALVVLLALFGGALALVNLIGAPIVAARGRSMARRARTAAQLIAGRELAAHAATAWRRVSSIAMISFIAVVGGSGIAIADMAGTEPGVTLFADIRTGVLVTLGAGFLLLAASVGVSQAASVLDDRELIVGLDRLGMSPAELARARRITVMLPLRWAAAGGAVVGAALALPVVGISLVVAPLTLLVIAVTFAAGFGAVALALLASGPLVAAIRRAAR